MESEGDQSEAHIASRSCANTSSARLSRCRDVRTLTLDCLEREFFENKTRTSVRFLEKKIAIVYDHYQGRRAMYLKSEVKVLSMTASHAYVIREKII